MKGPSLDAIRRFKEQQERKKREEDEEKIRSKLSTLEHRASQGDKKAKSELKRIEKVKEELNKPPEARNKPQNQSREVKKQVQVPQKSKSATRVETDFDELMRLAKQNTNQPKIPPPPKFSFSEEESKKKRKETQKSNLKTGHNQHVVRQPQIPRPREQMKIECSTSVPINNKPQPISQHKVAPTNMKIPPHIRSQLQQQQQTKLQHQARMHQQRMEHGMHHQRPQTSSQFRYPYRGEDYEDDDEEEDDYESDGFVVDDEDDDIQDEVSKTIRSVFRYDRRRCDLREQELDRQYRAIGRVSTFEDLEREERRASRLAAAEDARALKEEEERKRLKKLRLKK